MQAQVLKWGNSLAVRIPKAIAERAKLRAGDSLEIEVAAEGTDDSGESLWRNLDRDGSWKGDR